MTAQPRRINIPHPRGTAPKELNDRWLRGPHWMPNKEDWPLQPEVTESGESSEETVKTREKQLMAKDELQEQEVLTSLLGKYSSIMKLQRVIAYVQIFTHN